MATAATVVGRAAAILTNAEVQGATVDLSDALGDTVAIDLTITIASLTNLILKIYAGPATAPTDTLSADGVVALYNFTADTETSIVVPFGGNKFLRASVEGVGTLAASSCAFGYTYNDYETTAKVDGVDQIG